VLRPFYGVIKYSWLMLEFRSKQILGTAILVSVAAVTLVMAPYTLLDPINLPKLCALAFSSIFVLSLIAPTSRRLFNSDFRVLLIVLILFVLQILLVLFFSGANFGGQFYGTFGRNTGGLAYISLSIVILGVSLVADKDFLKKFVRLTLIIGAVLIAYGNIQYLGLEPFPFVNAYTVNAPIGTFGNPDFQSAFMGLINVVSITMALNTAFKIHTRIILLVMGFVSIIVIYETLAKQGYLNFVAGAGAVAILWLFMNQRNKLALALSGLGAVGGGLVFLGLINAGPLASFLYKGSLAARGFYWRAAIKMLTGHPFLGVGMDGFGDWYKRTRSPDYVTNNFLTVSNTAHNVYLDIASSGGFPLISAYFAILTLVIISIIKVVKRSTGFDVYFVAIVGAWVAYQTQAFISINQLGIAIWGWVLSGLIIGYEINTRAIKSVDISPMNNKHKMKKTKTSIQPLSSTALVSAFGGLVIAALVAIPPYYVNASFYSAVKSGDIKAIKAAAYLKPIDDRRLKSLASILLDNKYDADAIVVIRDAVVNYPDSYDFWKMWSTTLTATPSDLATAKAQLKRLDPFNPDLK